MRLDRFSKEKILVTGANGFIGKNLATRLREFQGVEIRSFVRGDEPRALRELVRGVDAVVHLAGANRPADDSEYDEVNARLTALLCEAAEDEFRCSGAKVPILLASSTQAELDNAYGRSKLAAEEAVANLAQKTGHPCLIFRLPGVFGKWCRPNYNSVVATFCHNISRDIPICVADPEAELRLVYVDDVIDSFLAALEAPAAGCTQIAVHCEYTTTLGDLASQIRAFEEGRRCLGVERVGTGLARALYATYISQLPKRKFSYSIPQHADDRGKFVEVVKTADSGQFSYFTASPGVTRGGHYHHTKTEKFLVLHGQALFRFRSLLTNELVELRTNGACPEVVDTIPGWSHDITNVGDEELIVMLWANENFDQRNPDTVLSPV